MDGRALHPWFLLWILAVLMLYLSYTRARDHSYLPKIISFNLKSKPSKNLEKRTGLGQICSESHDKQTANGQLRTLCSVVSVILWFPHRSVWRRCPPSRRLTRNGPSKKDSSKVHLKSPSKSPRDQLVCSRQPGLSCPTEVALANKMSTEANTMPIICCVSALH